MIAARGALDDELEGASGGRSDRNDPVEVRLAHGDDLDGVLSVGHRTWLATYEPITGPEYVAMGLAKWWTTDVVAASIRTGRTLVATEDDEVVGVATFGTQDDAFVLWKLYVLPGHHGHGLGSRLMAAVVDRAREAGHDRIVLSHIEGNQQAARFYTQHGFVETHRESGGSGLPVSVWMERRLDDATGSDAAGDAAGETAGHPAGDAS